MKIRALVCRSAWMTALLGALLAGCGVEPAVNGELSELSKPALETEASALQDAPVDAKNDPSQPPDEVTGMALNCAGTTVQWSQFQAAWNNNTYTSGTYYCIGTLPATASGFVATTTLTSSDRTGTAQYSCSNGSWTLQSGSCDGKIVQTSDVSGVSTVCSSADPVRSKWINWYVVDLKRCADTAGLDWWVTQYNNNADCLASTNYNGYGDKDTCWRAQFRAGANANGNSYSEAQQVGHVSSWDEASLCGSGAAYTWIFITSNGTKCKFRP